MRFLVVVWIFLIGAIRVACAQSSLVLENNPPLKWYQINTPNFKIIYPAGFEAQANRMANTMEHIRVPEAATLGSLPKKIPLILQNQSSFSNAFVSITPRRSEFYTMPSQNYNFIGNNDWMNLLAAHEYRHIVQFQHAKRGINKALYYLFGNNTLAVMSYVSAPPWFWEGDAVVTETAFTSSGRGRIPYFNLVFRTNLLEGRSFNYNKQFLRSYKHNIPDHYVLGYNMVSYLRDKTNDPQIWEKITNRAWRGSILPFTFSNAIKKEYGLHVKDLYAEMAGELHRQWQAQIDSLSLTPFQQVNTRTSNVYTDYFYPHELEDGSILVMRSGIGNIEELVKIKDGTERKVYTPGMINSSGMLSIANSRVVWNEYRYDPRWRVRTYSVIMGYDIEDKKERVISTNSRYASAAISPDGYKVATIESTTDYQTRLVVLDYFSGKILKEFENADNDFLSMPHWDSDNTRIYALSTRENEKAIVMFDLSSGNIQRLTDYTNENIGYPVPAGDYILFNSPRSGIDNIYALHKETGKRFQITNSKYGAYNASISKDGKLLYYNEQGRDGMDVVKIPFQPQDWKEVSTSVEQPGLFFTKLTNQENHADLFLTVPEEKFTPGRYSRFTNMFNPYSWGMYFNNDLTKADIGISSQDILSTTRLDAGYTFDIYERTGAWHAGISYQGFYPIIDANFTYGNRSVNEGDLPYEKIIPGDTVSVVENLTFDWKEKTVEVGLRLPIITTSSRFHSSFTLANYVGYTHVTDFKNSIDGGGRILPSNYPQYIFRDYVDRGNLVYNHFSFSAYRLLKQSRRDINSKWGQVLFMDHYGTPLGGDYSGQQFSFQGRLYIPGLARHHSIWGYWAYQKTSIEDINGSTGAGLNNYLFRNRIPLPRGHSLRRFEDFYSMSANYTLPIWYPDVNIGPLVNFQRVRANAFFDYGFGNSKINNRASSEKYASSGVEVKFDINVGRLLPQLDIGFRATYRLTPQENYTQPYLFEFLMGTINF